MFYQKNYLIVIFCVFTIFIIESESNERVRILHHHNNSTRNINSGNGGGGGVNRERRNEDRLISQNQNLHSHANVNSGGDEPNSNVNILQRINDKLTALQNMDEQKLKKLDGLEYKIHRLDQTNQQRHDSLRQELREISTRVQNLEWLTQKTEATMDHLREDMDHIKDVTHDDDDEHLINSGGKIPNIPLDFNDKLESLATLLASTRAAIHRLEKNVQTNGDNLSQMITSNKDFAQIQKNIPTKQFINNAINGLKNQQQTLMQSNGFSVNNQRNTALVPGNSVSNENNQIPRNCEENASKKTGIYKIQLEGSPIEPFYVYCDNDNSDGGWTVIQSRTDGRVNFYRNWLEYKNGFGNLGDEFWIGLDKLHEITASKVHELYIALEDTEGVTKYARYSSFAIGSERDAYAIILLGSYSGNAGDSLSYHGGQKFSTYDVDNDGWAEGSCAQAHTGAWWYNACDMSNLNGRYWSGEVPNELAYNGIYWNEFHGKNYSLGRVKMMIRPVQ